MFCRHQESIEGGPSTAHLGFGVFHSEEDGLSAQGASVPADLQLWKAKGLPVCAESGQDQPGKEATSRPGSSNWVATRASPKGRSGERASRTPSELQSRWSPFTLLPPWPVRGLLRAVRGRLLLRRDLGERRRRRSYLYPPPSLATFSS